MNQKRGGGLETVKEQHIMRYFFLPEIKYLAEKAGLTVVASYKWLTQEPLSDKSWYGLVVLRKNNN
ncbi:hypothetical protein AGMMS49959_19370 [Planctomycetales bacterium]|nr:hypothetical protein AGMMS49959_19370 [Planctomycetales bacterium]